MGYLVAFAVLLFGAILIYSGLQGSGLNLVTSLFGHTPPTAKIGDMTPASPTPGATIVPIVATAATATPGVIAL